MRYLSRWMLFVFSIMFFPSVLLAQDHSLRGKIVDATQNPLSFVNVLLLKESDTSIVMGVSSGDNGEFQIEGIQNGKYILKMTFIGYKEHVMQEEVTRDLDIGTIRMEETAETLNEVTVTGNVQVIEKKADRLVFNVENTSFSSQSSFDILRNTPGILVLNDQVMVRNNPATVYINDKRVYLSGEELKSLLENYSGSNIRSVEVITTPPARYDAENGAVVNIVTSRSISVGYKGSVNGRWAEAIFPKYNLGTDHYFKNNFLDIFVGYSYNPRKEYKHDNSYFNFFDGNTPDDQWEVDFRRTTRSYAHNLHTITDFTLNKKNSLSITANIQHSPGKTYDNNVFTNIFDVDGNKESYFLTDSELDNDRSNLDFSLNYTYNINDKGFKMSVISNYIYYNDRQFQLLYTDYFDVDEVLTDSNYFDFLSKQRNNIFTQQLDFYLPSEWAPMETGLKYSSISSNSSVVFDGDDIPSETEDDRFKYHENIYAAYVSFNKECKSWAANIGLRGEYTDVEANSLVLGEVNTQTYFEIFPTVEFQHTVNENHKLGISYNRSISRPRYGTLNPYRYYLFEKQYSEGNPSLTRSISNEIELSYTFKKKFEFFLYYEHSNNAIQGLTFQDNINQIISNAQYNIDGKNEYGLDFSFYSYIKNWWYFYTYMSGYYMENSFMAIQSETPVQKLNTMGYYSRAYNQFTLSKDRSFTADLSLFYMSNYIQGSFMFKNRFSTDIGLTKRLLKNRVIASLNLTDIFNKQNIWLTSGYQNQDNGYIARPETRTLSFSLKYNFGNYRLKDNKRNTTPDEQERLEE